ncbi:MAG: phosphoribosyltransferase [Longimicrobiales bacterium]
MIRGFRDRSDAGNRLAAMLRDYADRDDVLVLALPRGGVPVAAAIARELGAPLDVFLVRKLGVPGQAELAAGALAAGGIRVINTDIVQAFRISEAALETIIRREQAEIDRQDIEYRSGLAPPAVAGRTVILVDDGVATGSTVLAAVRALRQRDPARIILAVPVAARAVADVLRGEVEAVVCSIEAESLNGVSLWYDDFGQVTDAEVRAAIRPGGRSDLTRP